MTLSRAHRRPTGCPSTLALDELAAGDLREGEPSGDALREHVEECARCRQVLETRAADPLLAPDPTAMAPLLAAQRRPPARRRLALGGGMLAGGLAAVLVAFLVRSGHDAGERTKGALALTVHVRHASGAIDLVNDEGTLAAGEQMRFTLLSAAPGHAVVLGLDASPEVTLYAPAVAGAGAVAIAAGQPLTLPGSITADATGGVERVVAVVCAVAPAPEVLRQKALGALRRAGNRPEAVSSLGTGCSESGVLLRKRP